MLVNSLIYFYKYKMRKDNNGNAQVVLRSCIFIFMHYVLILNLNTIDF